MGRPPVDKKQRQLAVALPDELRGRLITAAAKSQRSIAEEIRRRLQETFDAELVDENTRKLLDAVAQIAKEIALETNHRWYEHIGSYLAFRTAISARLGRMRHEIGLDFHGPIVFGERPHQTGPGDDPEKIGHWAEYAVWEEQNLAPEHRGRLRPEREKDWREIARIQSMESATPTSDDFHRSNEPETGKK